jgi:O-antigen/teichoic acid export membrane protein
VKADRHIVRRLIAPALGFLAFPLGNALALQGPILIIGAVFGGPAVAMFSALRTLARVPMQLSNMFNSSVWPEMTRAYGAGDLLLLRNLHRASWGLTALLVFCMAGALGVLGRWIAHQWLGGQAPFDPLVFNMLLLLTVVSAMWNSSAVVLTATNSHLALGSLYIAVNAVGIALAATLTLPFGWWPLLGCLAAAELGLLAWVLPKVLGLTTDRFPDFVMNALAGGARMLMARRAPLT